MYNKKIIVALFVASLFCIKSFSQFTTSWAFLSNNTGAKAGTQQADITIADATIGAAFTSNIGYSSNGVKCQPASGTDWPIVSTDGFQIDFPISPNGAVDLTLTGLKFEARISGSSGINVMSLAYQADGAGAFIPFGTAQSTGSSSSTYAINFGTLTRKLYSGHTYIIRMYMYAASTGISSSRSLTIRNAIFTGSSAIAGTQPSVTTATAVKTGKYTGLATGVITPGTLSITESGVVWDVAINPTIALTSKNNTGPTTTVNIGAGFGGDIAGLTPSTLYHTRAYVISESGNVFYGNDLTFTTDAPTIASLTTNVASGITSIKATSGGVILDSGGVGITAKGVCWSTTTNPTIGLPTKTVDGIGNASFSSTLKILAPNTTYYARAYATNAIGTAYGNEITFATFAAQPVIITTTGNSANSIAFTNTIVNNISAVKSYTLTASALSTPSGSITVTAPAGFQISLGSGSGFASSLNIPYTGGSVSVTIYVRFVPTLYGPNTGIITHSGGGATATNIDDVTVTGAGIQNPGDFSNTGTDFWVGYASHNLMGSDGVTIQSNGGDQSMVLYLSNQNSQPTDVEVSIPGLSFSSGIITVAANSVYTFTMPNTIGTQYAQLYQEGKSAKGIHITSVVPIVVYAHIYGKFCSGASLLLPTNTWGIDYYAASYNQRTSSGSSNTGSYNYFFVIANEDNTTIEITPTVATLGGWVANPPAPYNVTLNKGEIYNVLATKIGGEDVTGSRVKSLDCNKKIALFSGSGRTGIQGICNSALSSDNLFAQVSPSAAWGTKYLTSLTEGTTGENIYRVFVKDVATIVKVNGDALPSTAFPVTLTNNFYYELKSGSPLKIESDKPISVTQYSESVDGCTNANGKVSGDPEMIFISPVQQAIEKATLYSPSRQQIAFNYINVIIPTAGTFNFMLDGVNKTSKFLPHPQDAGYSYASFDASDGVTTGQHTISSDVAFNAIAYGFGDANVNSGGSPIRESYGYNAGTSIKALTQYLSVQNPYANLTSDSVISACLNNDFKYTVSLPYKPLTMKWDFFGNSFQQPNNDTILVVNPLPVDSSIVNGTKLYKYSLPTTYKFTSTGTFPVNIIVNATNADGCTGLQTIAFSVKVVNPPTADFNVGFNGCPFDFANFTDISSGNGTNVVAWQWNFGGSNSPNTSNAQNPATTYPSAGTYNVTLRAINAIGCYKDTIKPFTIQPGPVVTAVTANNNGPDCAGRKITFTTTATVSTGTIAKWYWEFSDGKKDTTLVKTDDHIFTTAGSQTVKVFVETTNGCRSNVFTFNQEIYKPVVTATFVSPQCINDLITFTGTAIGTGTTPITTAWLWSFGDAANTTSTINPATFTYTTAGTYNVKLKVALLNAGTEFCMDTTSKQIVVNDKLAKPVVTVDATKTTTTSLTFSWAAIANATGYQVSTNGGATWSNPSSGATGTTHILTGLTQNTVHGLCVKALGNCAGDSACASGKTLLATLNVFVPTVFTPDGQGNAVNNKLILCANNVKSIRFMVFNQWGQKIYETSNPISNAMGCYEVWDGIAQGGKQQPTGAYIYATTITYNDDKVETKKGMFNLIR